MPRPQSTQPTPAELEILKALWDQGPGTVRHVMDRLGDDPPRAYTTIMTLMNVMHDKGLLKRKADGKAFVYRPAAAREKTLSKMLTDLMDRAFEGSASTLVAHLLDQANPDDKELAEIRKLIAEKNRPARSTRRDEGHKEEN